jgi:hypothetical protein
MITTQLDVTSVRPASLFYPVATATVCLAHSARQAGTHGMQIPPTVAVLYASQCTGRELASA